MLGCGLLLCSIASVATGQTVTPLPPPEPLLPAAPLPGVGGGSEAPAETPASPDGAVEPVSAKTCEELYREITALLEHRQTERRFWEDRKNQVAGATGFVFTPAWLFLGVRAAMHLQRSEESHTNRDRIAALRAASAQKLCFVHS
jgi:hypothetical protein